MRACLRLLVRLRLGMRTRVQVAIRLGLGSRPEPWVVQRRHAGQCVLTSARKDSRSEPMDAITAEGS